MDERRAEALDDTMKKSFRLLAALLLLTLSLQARAGDVPAGAPLRLLLADFGIFNPASSGKPLFAPTKAVPRVPGQGFGWVMLVRTDKPTLKVREELTAPEKPETWGSSDPAVSKSVSADGLTVTTEREVVPIRGMLLSMWTVAPGDPQGRHTIRIYIDGRPVRNFEFELK